MPRYAALGDPVLRRTSLRSMRRRRRAGNAVHTTATTSVPIALIAHLCVNHEYHSATDAPDSRSPPATAPLDPSAYTEMAQIELQPGVSVMNCGAMARIDNGRRHSMGVSCRSTPIAISGPAAGHDRMKTGADPAGRMVTGTMNNCAGGVTPWGTYLTGEENFDQYFRGVLPEGHRETENHFNYGIGAGGFSRFSLAQKRFDVSHEPNEPNRFGWIVEIDPQNPLSTPRKRTALRFAFEGAETVINPDGRIVSIRATTDLPVCLLCHQGRHDPRNRAANRPLTTARSAAHFGTDGSLTGCPDFGHATDAENGLPAGGRGHRGPRRDF